MRFSLAMRLRCVRRHAAALAAAGVCAIAGGEAWGARGVPPHFTPYVAVDSETVGPGKVAGVIRNVGTGPLHNVVLEVRHDWRWTPAVGETPGRLAETRRVVISDLVLPGAVKGFASVHVPHRRVPSGAAYSGTVQVLELTTIGIAGE